MIQSRRAILQSTRVRSDSNAGLWLDKYLDRAVSDQPAQVLVDEVLTIKEPPEYAAFYNRWEAGLKKAGAQTKVAQTQNRLAISLGEDSVVETSIALHRTYGVPFIPGSALKGLAAHFAAQNLEDGQWKKGGEAHTILFGEQDNAGYVTFFDALYIPGTGNNGKALWKDVMTVHHPEYYQDGSVPPADWDGTTIIPFLTATGDYLIALVGPDADDWVKKTFEILALALEHDGIGAKTSSGYGRMSLVEVSEAEQTPIGASYEILRLELLGEALPQGQHRGTVGNIQANGRYGFINPAHGGANVFVHVNQMRDNQPLREGQVVEYTIGLYQGRPQAQDVEVLLER